MPSFPGSTRYSAESMRASIAVNRPFHSVLLANTLRRFVDGVDLYTSAPRRFFRGLEPSVNIHMVPAPFAILGHLTGLRMSGTLASLDFRIFDRQVAATMRPSELLIGWAGMCLSSALKAKRAGSRFILDRACPHLDFQQAIVQREAELTGLRYEAPSNAGRNRQLEEYELADAILVPSRYTVDTFPEHLRQKLVKAPLLGRCSFAKEARTARNPVFTVGVVGSDPLRKGYVYLLRAWKKLALPNAKLLLRTVPGFKGYPLLEKLLSELPNVEFVGYVPNVADFYARCDVFVLPSVDDGFGMALIEAMSNGLPSVATSNCGASELLADGADALVVRPANEDDLATAILSLYESEDLRVKLALAAHRRAREIVDANLYERAIAGLISRVQDRQPVTAESVV